MEITKAKMRGMDSYGMLCSAYDAGWVDEPDGVLLELPEDAEVGDAVPIDVPEVRLCMRQIYACHTIVVCLQNWVLCH